MYQIRVVTNHCNLHIFLTSKNLLRHEAKWWKRLSGLDFAIEYYPGGKNLTNRPFCPPDYIESDEDKQVMHIVGYVTRSSTKNECAQNMAKGVQAPDSTNVISEPNQVLESQLITNKNPQSTTQSAQHDNRNIAMDSLVKGSKGPTNHHLLLKRRWASTRKQ